MSAPDITPYLLSADAQHPEYRIINTKPACFELLKLTLKKAGPDWGFIGKTATMDGDGKYAPAGFVPLEMDLLRPDDQLQRVTIVALSMDACWHIPTRTQIKVIVNSTANDDPRPEIHGPAKLTPYEIEPEYYRWHNPIITQAHVTGSAPPAPEPLPVPQTRHFPSYSQIGDDAFFRAQIGIPLQDDAITAGETLNDGSTVWSSRGSYLLIEAYWRKGNNSEAPMIAKKLRNEWRAILRQAHPDKAHLLPEIP